MRYHYEKPGLYVSLYGETYECDHPVYSSSTLFKIDLKGLAVIQQRFDEKTKRTWWGEIDPWLTDALYLHPKFKIFFDERSGECVDGLYPTVTIRQIMWALKLKPIPRQRWKHASTDERSRREIYKPLYARIKNKQRSCVLWRLSVYLS